MPKTNELKFDKNEFVLGLLKSGRTPFYAKEFAKLFYGEGLVSREYREYMGPESFEEIDSASNKNEFEKNIAKYLLECHNNPNSEFANETRKIWDFIKPVTYKDEYFEKRFEPTNFMIILNKMGIFNEETQSAILQQMQYKVPRNKYPEIKNMIATKMLQNSTTTNKDKYFAASELATTNHDVVRDFVEDAKQDLNTELNADMPNYDHIKDIVSNVKSIINIAHNSVLDSGYNNKEIKNPINAEYVKIVLDEFDLDKILSGGAEYVAKYQSTLESRVASAEERAKNAESRANTAEKQAARDNENYVAANRQLNEHAFDIRNLEDKNAKLTRELDILQNQFDKQSNFIKTIKMKIGALKTGILGNSGVKDLQDYIKNNQNESR